MDRRLHENLNGIQQNYIAPFLWLHNEPDEDIIAEIERIYESGIRSVCLESRTHEEFCREDWWSDIKLIFDKCKELGMNAWILDDKHFPTGHSNGIFKEKYKHLQAFGITEQHIDVVGPVTDGSAIAECWLESDEDEIVKISALKHIPNTERYSEIIDITDGLSDGMVYFDLPEGMWRIVFMIKTKRGRSEDNQAFFDVLNPETIDLFIEEIYEAHYKHFREYFGKTFLGFFSDEPSFSNNTANSFVTAIGIPFAHYPWHERIKKALNMNHLAGLWFDIDGITQDFRYSYMNTITNEYKKNFGDKVGAWCREHNVMYIGHVIEDNNTHAKTGNGAGHYFRALNGQDMAGIDVVLHQIIPGLTQCNSAAHVGAKHVESDFYHYYLAKLGSSLSHIDPMKKSRAMCEIFGAYGWAESNKIMKYLMDHMFVRGINYYVPHAFSPKPNDADCPPNFYDTGKNPQYKYFKYHMDYMNRMCHMLSDGRHIATCAILYDAETRWSSKNFLPLEKVAKKLYDNLFDYDIIPSDYLDKIKDSTLNGEKYNVLLVPYAEYVPEEISEKLKAADIKIVTVSEEETDSSFENVTLDKLIDYMNCNKYGDVSSDYDGIFLRYYHYTRADAHIYMFNNEDINNEINTKLKLSAFGGGEYIEYDAFENTAVLKKADGEIELKLKPYHSVLLIFGDVSFDNIPGFKEKKLLSEKVLSPLFKISTAEKNSKEFKPYKTTDTLINVTGRGEMPHFSGHIRYEAEFESQSGKTILDLGSVGESCELYINDKLVGGKLFPPYSFDISEHIKDGKNKITVIISNHNGYSVRDRFSKFLLFEPSGLLGPVKLIKYEA